MPSGLLPLRLSFSAHAIARLTTLIWIGLLVYLAALPGLPYVPAGSVSQSTISQLAHFSTHFILAALLYLSVRPSTDLRGRMHIALMAFGVSALLGLVLEILQAVVPNRTYSASDLISDTLGAAIGAALVLGLDPWPIGRRYASATILVVVLALTGITLYGNILWDPPLPQVGDRWRAAYLVTICGEPLPPMPRSTGGIRTHGLGDIRVQPESPEEAGANATLSRFYSNSGGTLTDSRITLPSGESYTNGDLCPSGRAGELKFNVRGRLRGRVVENPSIYVPRDKDVVFIEFAEISECPDGLIDRAKCLALNALGR